MDLRRMISPGDELDGFTSTTTREAEDPSIVTKVNATAAF
jgi:hypothetical protein